MGQPVSNPAKPRGPARFSDIRKEAQTVLEAAGFAPGSFLWLERPNRLVVHAGGKMRVVEFGGLSKVKIARALGRIEGWADQLTA